MSLLYNNGSYLQMTLSHVQSKEKKNKWSDYVRYFLLENLTLSHKGRVTNERIPRFVLWCFTYLLEGEKAPLPAVKL